MGPARYCHDLIYGPLLYHPPVNRLFDPYREDLLEVKGIVRVKKDLVHLQERFNPWVNFVLPVEFVRVEHQYQSKGNRLGESSYQKL